MALTIPYSGEPERPCRSNYPFNSGFVGQKTCKKVQKYNFNIPPHLYYYIRFLEKNYWKYSQNTSRFLNELVYYTVLNRIKKDYCFGI
jgi:hypothetical protein